MAYVTPLARRPPAPQMDFSVLFARFFARLIWLIRSQPDSVDDQKGALRMLVMSAKDGAVVLRADGPRLTANGTPLPEILTGIQAVASALSGPVSYSLSIDKGASPADILGLARVIASDSPDPLMQRVTQLALKTVRMEAVGEVAEPARARETAQLTTEMIAEIEADKARTAEIEAEKERAAAKTDEASPVASDRMAETAIETAAETPPTVAPPIAAPTAPPAQPPAAPPAETPRIGATGDETLDMLFARLAATMDPKAAAAVLDEITTRIIVHSRQGNVRLALLGASVLVQREQAITDTDTRRPYLVATRRIFQPQVLRLVMPALRRDGEREMLRGVLQHAGEEGASVVFEESQRARTLSERRDLIDVLRAMPATVPMAVKRLDDARWFVVRAAIDLLGELLTAEGERAVADMLKHSDERVRRAATAAVARYDTPFAIDALYRALADPTAGVRLQAVHGLATRRGNAKAAMVVVSAIDEEPEVEVQLAEIAALGRFATSEAVQKLARAAEPDGRLFGRKNPAYRVAAIRALAEARTPTAMSTLQALLADREKDVREAAAAAIAR